MGPDDRVCVARALGGLAGEFVVLHDLNIPGSDANIDHLIVGPTGVFMVEAKCGTGRLTAGADTLWRGSTPIRDECATAGWLAQQMSNVIGRPVQPVICFVGTALPEAVQQCNGVTVCESDALLFLLRDGTRWIEPVSVAAIAFVARPLVRADGFHAVSAATARQAEAVAQAQAAQAQAQVLTPTTTPLTPTLPVATRPTPSPRARASARRITVRPVFLRALPPVLTIGLAFAVWTLASPAVQFLASGLSDSPSADASPPTTDPASSTASATTLEVTDIGLPVPTDDFLPPLVGFTCPSPGQGWMATASPSEFRSDPEGFTMWHLDDTGSWVPWGLFKSGIIGPDPFGPVEPGATVQIALSRSPAPDPAAAAVVLQSTAPAESC